MDVKSYIKAARLRTLPLSVSGIIVGSFLGAYSAFKNFSESYIQLHIGNNQNIGNNFVIFFKYNLPIFLFAILTTLSLQILSNFANDYGDGVKGSDTNRSGEARMVSSGKITPKQMKIAMVFTTIITLIASILLIYVAFGKENFTYSLLFFGLGVASIAAAIKYTVGNSAYGYSGFGDIFVFLFFGLLSVVGSYFLYTKSLQFDIFLPAITIGLLSTAVLNLNNLRDVVEDKKNNKNTLVVKLGVDNAKKYHYFLIIGALFVSIVYVVINYKSPLQFLFLIAFIPLIINVKTVSKNKNTSLLDGELKKVALSTFLFSILFSICQIL